MLVEIHMIQNHAPSNLNRDDTGSPKDATFGGTLRARISSQCLKRSIRKSELFSNSLAEHLGRRTRALPRLLRDACLEQGATSEEAEAILKISTGFGKEKGKENKGDADEDGARKMPAVSDTKMETRQLIFLDATEVQPLARNLLDILRRKGPKVFGKMTQDELQKGIAATLPRSVDIALFGRMTTSPLFEDVEGCLQVAHAISTTKVDKQFDYFTAVDDLVELSGDAGAGMIGDVEFNSATYYKYFSLDWNGFVKNLGGDSDTAARALGAVLRAAALTTPTGKQNSFAAHNPPDAVLVEVKAERVPVSYANAFVKPIRGDSRSDVIEASIQALSDYSAQLKTAYGIQPVASVYLSVRGEEIAGAQRVGSLGELVSAVTAAVAGQPAETAGTLR